MKQIEILELKSTITSIKNSISVFKSIFMTQDQKISEPGEK